VFFFALNAFGAPAAETAPLEKPLVCDLQALTPADRERHHALTEKLGSAVTRSAELPDGYELTMDLERIKDSRGLPYCVVEVAEWVDLESRCCPFLDFGILQSGRSHEVRVRLTGGRGAKAFLRQEFAMLAAAR